jgi:hypothetical protein
MDRPRLSLVRRQDRSELRAVLGRDLQLQRGREHRAVEGVPERVHGGVDVPDRALGLAVQVCGARLGQVLDGGDQQVVLGRELVQQAAPGRPPREPGCATSG